MSMTKSSAAYQRWAEEQAREEANSYQEYLDERYWQEREEMLAAMPPLPEPSAEDLEQWRKDEINQNKNNQHK